MTTIAFIGLGIMGSPMAVHLVKAGYDVVGYNRTPDRTGDLEAAGGRAAHSISEAVEAADVVAIMVPDSPDVQQVLAHDGVFTHAKPGTLIVDFSSIRPDVTVELSRQAKTQGFRLLDAPVSGGEEGAADASLSIMVGGDQKDFEEALPIFETLGRTIVHVGGNGAGQIVKAANQLVVAVNLQALAEAVVFLRVHGVSLDAAFEVFGSGLAGSKVLDQKRDNLLNHEFSPGFRIDLHHKDMGIVTSAAREAEVVIPLGASVAQLMAASRAYGDGHLDHSGLLLGVERLCGLMAC